jgi:SecD/SecF fusion protein
MQGKGLIKVLLVVLIAVSLLQFSFFIPTNKQERLADDYATALTGKSENDGSPAYKLARSNYLDSISDIPIFNLLFIKNYTYAELKQQQLGLGLDLKGGMSAFLQVDLSDFLKGLAGRNANNTDFIKALDNANEALKTSQSDYITLFAGEYKKIAGDNKLAKLFQKNETLGNITSETDDATITRMLRQKATETVKLTFERLKQRIDKLGVAQPNVSLDPSRDLIAVEMPGIDNPERAEEFLTKSAKLEFWDVFRYSDPGIVQAFQAADRLSGDAPSVVDTTKSSAMRDSVVFNELGEIIDTIQVADVKSNTNTSGHTSGSLLSALSMNSGNMPHAVMGLVDKSKKRLVNEILAREDVKALFPKNGKFMWGYKPAQNPDGGYSNNYYLYLIKTLTNTDKAPLDGDVVTSATQALNPVSGQVEVNLRMNATGAKKWAEMTTKAAGDGNREIAIALDDEVVSAPAVNTAITGGSSSITGNFTVDEATDFAGILEVGKLPARTKIVQQNNVGPSLGQENIDKSLNALALGALMVVLTMLLYYSWAGFIAILALLLNVFFILGTLSSFGTVLTLSGIAGLVLTMGMAVDANVIIYERIKEELALGKSLKQSIVDGFHHSYSAIIDGNLTTILTAIILAYFGLGPVKGFAVVLIIGVVSSVFTAVFVSRLVMDWLVDKGYSMPFWTNFSKGAFKNVNFDWIGARKWAYIISGSLTLIGLISMFTKGFDLGVDYKGGYSYNIQFAQNDNIDAEKVRNGLTTVFEGTPVVKQVDGKNTYNVITSYLISESSAEGNADKVLAKLYEGVKSMTSTPITLDEFKNTELKSGKAHIVSSAQVGPTIADDLKRTSFIAGILAVLGIFLYILLRFNKWQYSVGGVVALTHDALMMLGIFSLLKGVVPFALEIDQNFIAALLTVLGYSINDSVIIYDRIREYFTLNIQKPSNEIINDAINSTLSRTMMTSFTTIIVVLVLFIFGGASIRGFAFALLIGIFVGTYSSVFISAPIMADLSFKMSFSGRKKKKNQ